MEKLIKVKQRSKKRLGRGYGSGKGGHTSSRGTKGQKARRTIHPMFEGLKRKKSLLGRLPLQRGKLKLKSALKPEIISLTTLEGLGFTKVGWAELTKAGYGRNIKILASGKLTKKIEVLGEIKMSAAANKKIVEAGGKIF